MVKESKLGLLYGREAASGNQIRHVVRTLSPGHAAKDNSWIYHAGLGLDGITYSNTMQRAAVYVVWTVPEILEGLEQGMRRAGL